MPTQELEYNGFVYEIEAPEDSTPEQLLTRIRTAEHDNLKAVSSKETEEEKRLNKEAGVFASKNPVGKIVSGAVSRGKEMLDHVGDMQFGFTPWAIPGMVATMAKEPARIGNEIASADPERMGAAAIDTAALLPGVVMGKRVTPPALRAVKQSTPVRATRGAVADLLRHPIVKAATGIERKGMPSTFFQRIRESAASLADPGPIPGVSQYSPNTSSVGVVPPSAGDAAIPFTTGFDRYAPNLPSYTPAMIRPQTPKLGAYSVPEATFPGSTPVASRLTKQGQTIRETPGMEGDPTVMRQQIVDALKATRTSPKVTNTGLPPDLPVRGGYTGRGELSAESLARQRVQGLRPEIDTRVAPVESPLQSMTSRAQQGGGHAVAGEAARNAESLNARIAKVAGESRSPVASHATPTTPTRIPPGVGGDEYKAIRESGGPFATANRVLTPEERAAEELFWEQIAREGY